MIPSPLPVEWVTKNVIREVFNTGQFLERVESGELVASVKNKHLVYGKTKEPYCTKSQYITYYDPKGNFVVDVHQYLRPDGKLGASGKPDPKRIVIEGKILAVRSRPT